MKVQNPVNQHIKILLFAICLLCTSNLKAQFKVLAFYTAENDLAHISFVNEANEWFREKGDKHNFEYHSTNNWDNLNEKFLSKFQVVLFLDTRPEKALQRKAFQRYMDNGGSWIGFHFTAFSLENSTFPPDWDWYHNEFLGVGQYKSNTWRPTSAILKIENRKHPIFSKIPKTIKSSPCEWYRWENDLRELPNFEILLSVDAKSFPLGTGPKLSEIWKEGYYPIAWTNNDYNMLYFNMGHNDMDYEGKTNAQLSSTFSNKHQNRILINSLLWLAEKAN